MQMDMNNLQSLIEIPSPYKNINQIKFITAIAKAFPNPDALER